jgi:hypothetical protein
VSDQLNDFIAAQHETNLKLTDSMARCEAGMERFSELLAENTKRLFGGDGVEGALPYIMKHAEQNAKTAEDRCEKVEKRAARLENWKRSSLAWVAGAVAVLTLEGTALAFYFHDLASKLPPLH